MRYQVVALFIVAFIASSQCQEVSNINACIKKQWELQEAFSTFNNSPTKSDLNVISALFNKIKEVITPCAASLREIKTTPFIAGTKVNLECVADIIESINKIRILKGQVSGSSKLETIISMLTGFGLDITSVKQAIDCQILNFK